MFTGIIEEVGEAQGLKVTGGGASIVVSCRRILEGIAVGDSVAVNGVCLTAVHIGNGTFTADISEETLGRSTLGELRRGSAVNLERALSLNSRLGGHIVQGHVDSVGKVTAVRASGAGRAYSFSVPQRIEEYLVEKGSIAVDGISLTVSSLAKGEFSVAAVPHTVEWTNLKWMKEGDAVNLEIDIIAKYVHKYVGGSLAIADDAGKRGGSLEDKLAEGGFM